LTRLQLGVAADTVDIDIDIDDYRHVASFATSTVMTTISNTTAVNGVGLIVLHAATVTYDKSSPRPVRLNYDESF